MRVPLFLSLIIVCILFAGGCVPAAAPAPEAPTATPVPPTPIPSTPTPVPPTATPAPPAATPVPPTAATVLPTPAPELMKVLRAYEAAYNSGDVSGATALFADVFLISDSTMSKREDLANMLAFEAALHQRIQYSNCRSSRADQIICDVLMSNDCIAALGFESLPSTTKVTIRDMKIAQTSGEVTGADAAINDKWEAEGFLPWGLWVLQERTDERAKFIDSHGNWIANAETGAIVARLCQEYAALKK